MPAQEESPQQIPTEERLRATFQSSAQPLVEHLRGLGGPHYDNIGELTKGIATNGIVILWGTKHYDQDMENVGRNEMRRPFGIEMNTLSRNTQIVLYPKTVYKPNDEQRKLAEEAVQNATLYLHLDERDLPQILKDSTHIPSLPWIEYGKNRWNRSHQLFGRYEALTEKEALRVDYRLDSTHMPALYGFFDTIEMTRITEEGINEHIIFGQEMGEEPNLNLLQFFGANLTPEQLQDSVVPIIIAGDFDFNNVQTPELLGKLATDTGIKPDVGRVIADVLRLSAESRLHRIQHVEKEDPQ